MERMGNREDRGIVGECEGRGERKGGSGREGEVRGGCLIGWVSKKKGMKTGEIRDEGGGREIRERRGGGWGWGERAGREAWRGERIGAEKWGGNEGGVEKRGRTKGSG